MLVTIQRSKRRPEGPKERRQPEQLARDFLQDGDRAFLRLTQVLQQAEQALQLGRFKANSEAVEVEVPANPYNLSGKMSFMPAHRDVQFKTRMATVSSQAQTGAEKRQKVIHIDQRRVGRMDEPVQETNHEARYPVPIKPRCTSAEVEGQGLIQATAMAQAKKALVSWTDAYSALCFSDAQDHF